MGKKEITNLEPFEVSLVKSPANNKKFLMWKNKEGEGTMGKTEQILKEILESELKNEAQIDDILKANELDGEAADAVKSSLKFIQKYAEQMPDGLLEMLSEVLSANESFVNKQTKMPKVEEPSGGGMDDEEEEEEEGAGGGDGDMTEIEEECGGGPKKRRDGMMLNKEEIQKMKVPQEVKDQLLELWKAKEDLREKLEKEENEKREREFVAKAAEFKNLPIQPEDFGKVLKGISEKAGVEFYTKLETLLKSADELIAKSKVFEEVGGSGSGLSDKSSMTKIEKAAESIRQANPNLTKEQAITKALEINPELYSEYMEEIQN